MSLEISWTRFKTAMRAKDTVALEALRAIKSELLLAQTATDQKRKSQKMKK
jgi:uncharacterized protein YqeY